MNIYRIEMKQYIEARWKQKTYINKQYKLEEQKQNKNRNKRDKID